MDALLIDALITGGGVLAFGVGHIIGRKTASVPIQPVEAKPAPQHHDIPMIEIDGALVPHPTIVARRQLLNG